MKKIAFIFFSAVLLLFFSGCKKDHLFDCFKSTGNEITVTRSIPYFHSIEMNDKINLEFHSGYRPVLEITGGSNLTDGISTEVRNETLYIHNENRCNWMRDFNKKITVRIFCDSIRHITNYGSGDIQFADTLQCNDFYYDNWHATGTMDFLLDIDRFYCNVHLGTADVFTRGKVNTFIFYYNGYGYMHLENTLNQLCYVTNSGTGDIYIRTENELHAVIEESGNIYYSGNPTIVESKITGTGKLIKIN